jgi:PHP family Zn ribbon phosphoesterase
MDAPEPVAREVLCQRCGHQWTYKGTNPFVVTCPHCCTKVTLRRSEERLRRLARLEAQHPDGAAPCA